MQTINEQRALTERQLLRIERANPDHFRFPRHSGPYERSLPFIERADVPAIKDAALGAAVLICFVAVLVTMPWWIG